MVFGKLITTDLCRCCNSRFGDGCDFALAEDKHIVEAAQRAGLSIPNLWSQFEGFQHTSDGRPVKTVFKGGSFRPQAQLNSLHQLSVAATEGRIRDRDLKNLRARLISKVRAKSLNLSESQIVTEIDQLLNELRESPEQTHYNSVIQEGFRASPLNSKVRVSKETRPWETHWALAKIVFELSNTVVTNPYRAYFAEVVRTIKTFLERRACSEDRKQGPGIFTFTELPSKHAARFHTIEGIFTPLRFEWHLTFFGTARWSYSQDVSPIRAPAHGQRVLIENPTENGASVRVEMHSLPPSRFVQNAHRPRR
jgi:hypothetical protein